MPLTDTEQTFLDMRRRLIGRHFERLNPEQQAAVTSTEGPVLVLAGAGSGKTTVLIHRVYNLIRFGRGSDPANDHVPENLTYDDFEYLESCLAGQEPDPARLDRLLADDPCPPWRIIAITFTNKAAGELRERLSRMLGPEAEDIWAATFHSACVRILRRYIDRLGYDKSFTIYDADDSRRVMTAVLKELNIDDKRFTPKSVLDEIGRAKDALVGPKEYAESAGSDFRRERIARCYTEYQKRLRSANALDFDDIIFETVRLLETDAEARSYYQDRFRYVLIDEYQDTNQAQNRLASLLSGRYGNLCVVGDDDQSIYRFRGATVENILGFDEDNKNCRVYRLEQNYRSTSFILDAANKIIGNNVGRKGKNLWTAKRGGDPITLYTARDEQAEASFIAQKVVETKAKGGKFSDCTVLYRMNAQSAAVEQAFSRLGVPYRIIGGLRFFDRAEVKDMLSYLCLIANRSDDLRLGRIINVPARGIGDRTMEIAAGIAAAAGEPIFNVLSRAGEIPELSRAAAKLSAFCQMINDLAAMAETALPSELYEELLSRSGYRMALIAKGDMESQGRLENIDELKSTLIEFEKRAENPTLSAFLEEVSLFTDLDNYDPDEDAVIMMTVHSAKGLEFPTVFICGMEEGLFPSFRSIGSIEDIEEERRLAYVAVTRAKKNLYITCAKRRMIFGSTQYNSLSRFAEEIPENCLVREEDPSMFREARSGYEGFATRGNYGGRGRDTGMRTYFDDTPAPRAPRAQTGAAPAGGGSSFVGGGAKTSAPASSAGFRVGERIRHKAFGEGVVVNCVPMGGDQLVEVEFASGDKKKLMAKSAARFVERI